MESSIAVFLMRHSACELMPIKRLRLRNKKNASQSHCVAHSNEMPIPSLGGAESLESKGNGGCEPVRLSTVLAQDHFYSDF